MSLLFFITMTKYDLSERAALHASSQLLINNNCVSKQLCFPGEKKRMFMHAGRLCVKEKLSPIDAV